MHYRVLILALGSFASGTGALVLVGLLPLLAADLGVSATAAGQSITVYALTYALSAPLLAAATAALPRRAVLVAAMLAFAAGHLLGAFAPNFGLLLFSRAVAALGGALYGGAASATGVALVAPEQRGRALATISAGVSVSTVLGIPLGAFLGGEIGWRPVFLIVVALSLVAAGAVFVALGEAPAPPAIRLRDRLAPLRRPVVVAALGVMVLQIGGQFVPYTYVALYLRDVTGLGGTGISAMLFLFGVTSTLGIAVGGWATDRWGAAWPLVGSIAILAVALLAFSFVGASLVATALVMTIWSIVGWAFTPPQQFRLISLAPEAPAIALALNFSALYLGNAIGSALGGLVVRQLGVAATGWVAAIMVLGALGVAVATFVARPGEVPAAAGAKV
jgi:MFS transporter, DHA1 family, inner membrane transport protein